MIMIGLYADPEYTNYDNITKLLEKDLGNHAFITLPVLNDVDVKMRNFILLNTNYPVRVWEPDPVEVERMTQDKVDLLSDHMFLSYLKFFDRSKLYIFAKEHHIIKNSFSYSSRVQSMIIGAHLANINYEIIK